MEGPVSTDTFAGFHLLWVPVDGPFHLYSDQVDPVSEDRIKVILHEFNHPFETDDSIPRPAKIEARVDQTEAQVWFSPNPTLPVNLRARLMVSQVFGWHMVFHGCVLIDGLNSEQIGTLIREYG